jgi:hypothetical protein
MGRDGSGGVVAGLRRGIERDDAHPDLRDDDVVEVEARGDERRAPRARASGGGDVLQPEVGRRADAAGGRQDGREAADASTASSGMNCPDTPVAVCARTATPPGSGSSITSVGARQNRMLIGSRFKPAGVA